jgi:CarD family transcriptional regulator
VTATVFQDTRTGEGRTFQVGDAVVHPIHGAGVVTDIEELKRREGSTKYYKIKLLGPVHTSLRIPVQVAKERGLRHAIRQSRLGQVWRVLCAAPKKLPANYKERYQVVESSLRTGKILRIAEAVRDMAWRRKREGKLNTRGKRMYERGVKLLAGEIAAAQGTGLADAEVQVRTRLWESLHPEAVI